MTKFALIIDYTGNSIKNGYSQHLLNATTLVDAMNEAEKFFDTDVYLMKIAEKVGGTTTNKEYKYKETSYKEVLVNRHNEGWHSADIEHSESSNTWKFQNWGSFVDWELCIER